VIKSKRKNRLAVFNLSVRFVLRKTIRNKEREREFEKAKKVKAIN